MRIAIAAWLFGMLAPLSTPTFAATSPNNIRIVTFQTIAASKMMVNMDALKEAHSICRQVQGLGPSAFPMGLSEALIRQQAGTRVWKYFSGKAQAQFSEQASFFVNMDTCRVYQESTYRAHVQIDCEAAWAGSAGKDTPEQVTAPAQGQAACFKSEITERSRRPLATLSETKINGVPCLFRPDEGQVERVKYCTYGRTPFYMDNSGRPVTFEVGKDMTGPIPSQEVELEKFQDGDFNFDPQQFTKQAVLDWIRRPVLKEYK